MPRHTTHAGSALPLLLAMAALLLPGLAPLHAQATYVVDSTGDGGDADVGDGVCDDGTGACTLRAAIEQANATGTLDEIHFDIPGTGPHTIVTASSLVVLQPVVIDGYTQPGSSVNTIPFPGGIDAVLMVTLDATGAFSGLDLRGGSTVRGLRFEGAGNRAIAMQVSGGNTVEGNAIRPGAASYGITMNVPDNTIGGTSPAARNVIGGGNIGIWISSGATGTLVQGNLVGTDAAGTGADGNVGGVVVQSPETTVGGATPGAGNVISANRNGVVIDYTDPASTVVQGNLIGTDVTGTADLGNESNGIHLAAPAVLVGGTTAAARNIISGNGAYGIRMLGTNPTDVVIQGNHIGMDITGSAAIPNEAAGMRLINDGHLVGGAEPGAGNVIAGNAGPGILVGTGSGIRISRNAIFSNGGLGIDLGAAGVQPNDPGDGDEGPNGLQNFPVVSLAYLDGGTVVEGTLNSTASTQFTLEFFASDACDPTGHGEGQRFLGAAEATTDGSGDADFTASLDGPAAPGDAITATATDADGSTSEFSACVTGVGYDVAVTATEGIVARGQDASYDVTVSAIAGTFDRDVTLSCDGLPAGASCVFTPATVQPGAASATSALAVATTAPETPTGEAEFTVVGAYGSTERTAAATVTVTDFTIAAAPEQVTVTGGEDATFTVTVAPDGPAFGEAVLLGCSGLPAGASCSFAPAQVTPGSDAATATLTVSTVPLTAGSPAAYVDWTPRGGPLGVPTALALLTLAAAVLLGSRRRLPRRLTPAVAVLGLVALASLACGDPTGPDPEPDPDPVTTTFTITGTSGELEHSTTATVRVE